MYLKCINFAVLFLVTKNYKTCIPVIESIKSYFIIIYHSYKAIHTKLIKYSY